MTNRLQKLERERERLEQALSDDPQLRPLFEARRSTAPDSQMADLTDLEGVAESELIAEYVKVVHAIRNLKSGTSQSPEAQFKDRAEFRTRVHVKPPPGALDEIAPTKPADREPIDDLTSIRSIDRRLARQLNEVGISSFNAIANWDRHEVRRVRDALSLGKRIWRENWIEQAALLQMQAAARVSQAGASRPEAPQVREPQAASPILTPRAPIIQESDPALKINPQLGVLEQDVFETIKALAGDKAVSVPAAAHSPKAAPEEPPAVNDPAIQVPVRPVQPAVIQSPPVATALRRPFKVGKRPQRLPAPAARRFAYIRGVSDVMAEALRGAGVNTIADISNWSRADVRWFQAILGDEARINQDQWIEQAALLARGVWTKFALRVVNGETRLLVDAPHPIVAVSPAHHQDTKEAAQVIKTAIAPAPVPPTARPTPSLQTSSRASTTSHTRQTKQADAARTEEALPAESPPARTEKIRQKLAPVERFDPMRSLTTAIALGKIKRPPPDLGMKLRQPETVDHNRTSPPPVSTSIPDVVTPAISVAPVATPHKTATTDRVEPVRAPISEHALDAAKPAETGALTTVQQHTPPVAPPDEDFGIESLDDWNDADALVIKRVEQPTATGTVNATATANQSSQIKTVPAQEDAPTAEPNLLGATADQSDWDSSDPDLTWGDEAEVVIVTRPRTKTAAPPVPARPTDRPAPVKEPRLPTQLMRIEDDEELPYADYGPAVEEATVTIIRAEASATNAASIIPNEIANDAEASSDPEQKPKSRVFGTRFLKALTGD